MINADLTYFSRYSWPAPGDTWPGALTASFGSSTEEGIGPFKVPRFQSGWAEGLRCLGAMASWLQDRPSNFVFPRSNLSTYYQKMFLTYQTLSSHLWANYSHPRTSPSSALSLNTARPCQCWKCRRGHCQAVRGLVFWTGTCGGCGLCRIIWLYRCCCCSWSYGVAPSAIKNIKLNYIQTHQMGLRMTRILSVIQREYLMHYINIILRALNRFGIS